MPPQTPVPEANYAPKWGGDTRPKLPTVADERELLVAYLDHYRATVEFAGEDIELVYYSDEWPEQDFEDLSGPFEDVLATWHAICARSREIVASHALDDTGTIERSGERISLRAVLLKMITEYARHCGHADFLREAIDGATGH